MIQIMGRQSAVIERDAGRLAMTHRLVVVRDPTFFHGIDLADTESLWRGG